MTLQKAATYISNIKTDDILDVSLPSQVENVFVFCNLNLRLSLCSTYSFPISQLHNFSIFATKKKITSTLLRYIGLKGEVKRTLKILITRR